MSRQPRQRPTASGRTGPAAQTGRSPTRARRGVRLMAASKAGALRSAQPVRRPSHRVTTPRSPACAASTPAEDGKKRVGLVVDYGTSSDAPDGEAPPSMLSTCAVVPEDANGYDVLVTVAQLRTDGGLICGINGYPASECGAPVSDPTPDPTGGSDQGSGGNGNGDGGTGSGNGSGGDGGGASGPTSGSSASTPGNGNGSKQGDPKGKKNDDGKKSDAAEPSPSASAADDATPAAAAIDGSPAAPSSGSPIGLIVGLIVVVGIGVTAIVLRRRKA